MKLTRVNYFCMFYRSEVINIKTVSQINAKFSLFTTWCTVNITIFVKGKSKNSFFEMMNREVLIFLNILLPVAFSNNITDQTVKPLMMKFGHKTQILQCYQFPNGGGFSVRYSIIRMSIRKMSCLIFRHFVHMPTNIWLAKTFFRLTHYTADFRQYNLDNKASSCCFSGVWILYDDYNYKFNNNTVRCNNYDYNFLQQYG